MARETFSESQIPANGAASVPYPDHRAVTRELMGHSVECFIGKVTGAGGAGGTLTGVPFEPAVVEAMNQAGATPALYKSIFASSGAVHASVILATAANANPPTLTKVGDNNWTVGLPTQMAPDTEVVTVICWGARDRGGSE